MAQPAAPVAVLDPRRRSLILAAVCAALAAVIASMSGLNIAQQAIAVDLGASQGDLLWVVNGYTVALAALLLPIGALGDRWGRKHILTTGLALFLAGNVAAAMASSVEALIAFRVLTGVAAAMIMPATLSIITSSFPADARGRAVGVWAGFAGAGGILGLLISSFLIDRVSWPWLFVPPLLVATGSLILTVTVVPNSREAQEHRFDVPGSVLAAVAVGGIVLGIHEGPERGWTDALTLTGLVAGGLALVGFALWELRQAHPLLDLHLFRDRALAAGSLALFVPFLAMFGIMLVLVQFMAVVLGYSAFTSALSLLPMASVMMGLSPVAPAIAAEVGARRVMGLGLTLVTAGLVLLATMVGAETYLSVLPGLLVLAAGMGITMTPATTAITGSLPADEQGVASALNDTVREVGGAIGVALLGSMLNSGYQSSIAASAAALPPEQGHSVTEGIAGAGTVAAQLGHAGAELMVQARHAYTDGLVLALWVGAVITAVGAVLVVALSPKHSPAIDGEPVEAVDADLSVASGTPG